MGQMAIRTPSTLSASVRGLERTGGEVGGELGGSGDGGKEGDA